MDTHLIMVYRPPINCVLPTFCFTPFTLCSASFPNQMFHTLYRHVSRETHVPHSYVPRGTKLMLLTINVLACGTPVEHSSWEGLFPIVPGGLTCDILSRVG